MVKGNLRNNKRNKKRNKGLTRKVVATLLVFIQFTALFSPFVVYADEEEGAGKVEQSSREGNIYAEGNTLISGAFESTSEYDPYVHYVTTYNTLMSRVGELTRTSQYANLYKGEHGEAVTGSGSAISDKYEERDTDSLAIIKRLEGIEDEEEEEEGDDLTAIDAGGESPIEDDVRDPAEAQAQVEALQDEIAKDITDNIYTVLKQHLSLGVSSGDVKYHSREGHGYNEGDSIFGGDPFKRESVGSGYLTLNSLKKAIGKGSGNTEADTLYKEKLYKEVRQAVDRKDIGLEKTSETFAENSTLGRVISEAEVQFGNEYLSRGVNVPRTLITEDGSGTWGNYWNEYKKTVSEWNTEDVVYLIRVSGYKKDNLDKARQVVEKDGIEFVSRRFLWNYNNLPVDRSAIGKQITDAYNSSISTKSQDLKGVIKANEVAVPEDVRTLAWTPIYPVIDTESKFLTNDGAEAMQKVDSTMGISGNTFTHNGETRPLQSMDIFLEMKNHSPVIVGNKAWTMEAGWSADTAEGVGASTAKVSDLHVGSTSGSIKSGSKNTGRYVWFVPDLDGNLSDRVEVKPNADVSKETMSKGNYMLGLYSSKSDSYTGNFASHTVGSTSTMGVDNYGNVINGETGEVILPYWQNHMFDGVDLNNTFLPHSPMLASFEDSGEDFFGETNKGMMSVSGIASNDEIKQFVGGDNSLYKDAITVKNTLDQELTPAKIASVMNTGVSGMSKDASMRGLAAIISASTKDSVEAWNTAMLEDAKKGGELYISFSAIEFDRGLQEELENQRWTAASLIQRVGWIMDYGFSDVLRLTVVSNLTRTYNTTIAESGLENVFYTETITNSEGWGSMIVLLSTIIGAVLSGYLLLVGFKAYRGEIAWSKVMVKALVLSGVLIYPMVLYGNMVDYAINKPTTWILGNQMKMSAVLDTYFAEQNLTRNTNEFYENMFGKYSEADALQLGSYNVTFYTTTDKKGFNINTTEPEDSSLSMIQSRRLERYQAGISEYPKDQLVSVSVPLTDLYKWVWDVRYRGIGISGYEETYGDSKGQLPTYEDVVGAQQVKPLFEWLAEGGSSYFGVEGYEPELASYEEYKVMPETISPLDEMYVDDIANMNALSTYGAGFVETVSQTGSAKHLVTEEVVESTLGLEVLGGSELFYEIVRNSSGANVHKNLQGLEDISKMMLVPERVTSNTYIPTEDDMRALIRDLSNTSRGREYWYGDKRNTPERERWSNFTRATFESGSQGSTNGVYVGIDGQERRLSHNPEIRPPHQDFLGLTYIVDSYTPSRGEVNPYRRSTLEEDVSDINEGLINNYISTYSITKMSLGGDEGRDQDALAHAELMVMATEAFFQFNDSLDWNHFPQGFEVDTIKFDKYMALVFIPFKDYGEPVMTFFDDSKVIPMSTAEYIAMNDSVLEYFAFVVAVIGLVLFGLFYLAVLYFGLLVFSMYNFVYYYVIKSDFQNKSALGSMAIMGIMSLSKMALMLVIWASSWIMNKTIAISPVNKPAYMTTGLHSLVLIASVVLIFMFVIKPTWKGVMGDKENMGGQFFTDKAQDIGKKLTSGGFMPGRGKGVEGGSQASKFKNKNKGTGDNMRNNAGRLGNIDEKGLGRARKQAGGIGGAFGFGGGQGLGSNTKRRVGKVRDALQRTQDKKRGINRTGRKFVDPSKVKAKNLVERKQLGNLGKTMNNIVQTTSGLASTAVDTARVGKELANFQTGTITTMAMGSAGAAAIVAKNLASQGLKARADGENVLFDSSGYDLEDQSVRSELFNNSVAELQDQNVLKHANVQKGKVDGSTAVNYDYSRGDSRLGLTLDEKTGIHPETFNQLAQTQEFKDLFIAPRENELTYDAKGNIIGLPDGGLRLVNPQMTATEVQNKMNNLYNADNKIREENNLITRDDKDKNGINIEGMDEKYYNENIAPIIKDQRGMYSHGSRIVYDKMNPMHQSVISQINQKVDEYNTDVEKGYGSESNNLMRYVVNDGDNQGIVTETVHGDDNKVLATMVHGTNDYKQKVSKFKVNDSEVGQIGDNVEAVNNLRNVALNDKKLGRTVNEFTEAKKDMRTLFTNEVNDMSANDRVTFSQEMMGYLDQTQIGNTPEFKTVKSNLHSIEQQFKQNEISEAQYHELVRRENDNLTKIMDSTGKLDGFILNRYDGSNNPYINKYEDKAKANTKGDKKKYKKLTERYNESVDKLDKKVGRKNLMEMPLGVVENTVSKNGEEYQLDGKGVLVQRTDARRKRNSFNGKDSDSVMSYLMKRPIEINDMRKRKVASK